jgi:hypothetical protein
MALVMLVSLQSVIRIVLNQMTQVQERHFLLAGQQAGDLFVRLRTLCF